MKRGLLRDIGIYAAGVLTIPLLFVGSRVAERISHNFDPSYTGRVVSGYVVSETKPQSPRDVYELELRGNDGQIRKIRVDCNRSEPIFSQVRGKALKLEREIYQGDFVEFQQTKKGEPTWLWNLERNSCPSTEE